MIDNIMERVPTHVPQSLVLQDNPWHNDSIQPHEWMRRVVGDGGFRYSPYSPLPQREEGCWIAVGAKEIRAVLIDNRTFISRDSTGVAQLIGEDLVLAPLESDAPDHQRLRGILQPMFQPAAVKKLQSRIRALTMELIEGIGRQNRSEFIQDFAVKLPTTMFLEIMGLPLSDLPIFLKWEDIVMGRQGPEGMAEAWLQIRAYLQAAIEERRRTPRDDVLGRIVSGTAEQGVNPESEALGMAMILFVAGLDTVVTALGWHFKYLAEHPAEQERLRQDPSKIPAAVDELLRAFSFTTLTRTAVRDVEVCGVSMKAGDRVVCPGALGSRDPQDYAEAEKVDFDRGALRHLAFGFGQHICLGMHLAKLELITAIECWLTNLPAFRLAQDFSPSWHGGISLGLDVLELEW